MIAKIVFFKDTDVLSCSSNPRFSELRPLKFMPDYEWKFAIKNFTYLN